MVEFEQFLATHDLTLKELCDGLGRLPIDRGLAENGQDKDNSMKNDEENPNEQK